MSVRVIPAAGCLVVAIVGGPCILTGVLASTPPATDGDPLCVATNTSWRVTGDVPAELADPSSPEVIWNWQATVENRASEEVSLDLVEVHLVDSRDALLATGWLELGGSHSLLSRADRVTVRSGAARLAVRDVDRVSTVRVIPSCTIAEPDRASEP